MIRDRVESISLDEMRTIQGKRLVETVKHVYDNVAYYRRKMESIGLLPGDIRGYEDLHKLPFTTKADLIETYPYGMVAVDMDKIVRVHASSGTTGKRIVVAYTKEDIDTWADVMARCFARIGTDVNDVVQVAYGYGLFTGGLGTHYGAERLGATVIPISGGNSRRQVEFLIDLKPTVIACTPSYMLHLYEVMTEAGVTVDDISLKAGLFGAEPWSENMRKEIERLFNIKAYDIYGLSEITGPGVASECCAQNGLHINEDCYLPEIVDTETQQPLGLGMQGEIVFTTIKKKGMPLIRYRTKDITKLFRDDCRCKRTLVKMERVMGRTDDMLIIRGVNVFPSQIESVLLEFSSVTPNYQIVVDRINMMDTLEVRVEMNENLFSDEVRKIEMLERNITGAIESVLGISAKVKLAEPKSIERSEGKAVRIIDRRKI
ncbi:MAG TPA: phenylacetate--CoA ligase [Clostridia bacterium]|jgi:phenylacetate-CoA ligase|nr:phenylacetate--CoA ligase [Clostridiaceae bacterium]HOF26909.1 phenylacetate--CoA ligase [Clostridia bacterium]HOM34562.1 phenylacetate--CoA ligase [Clostridia bacterium]HOR89949.1 phenylacetate--CoA ligase [Clostridia bacterium]HOT70200.1 phenylacetate--CoA ligase [Clostridia bacterium]